MEKVKPILKALLFGAIMLLFFICSSLIAKSIKLSKNRTFIFQGGMMLLSTIIPIFYIGVKQYDKADIGFNKINASSLKKLLFYIPFVIASFSLNLLGLIAILVVILVKKKIQQNKLNKELQSFKEKEQHEEN